MGNNNVACFHRHRGSLTFPSHLKLGTYATIKMTTCVTRNCVDGSFSEKGEISHSVEGSMCKLTRILCKEGNVNVVKFSLHDSIICSRFESLYLMIRITETCFLRAFDFIKTGSPITWTKTRKNVHVGGGVTVTKVYLYGTTNRCGLLVLECEKHDCREDAETVTMAHYIVSTNGSAVVNRTSERTDTTNVGFSVVVKVGVCDEKFDITMEGPERHPISGLLYMFEEVNRSGIWKPNMCPHCGGNSQSYHHRTPPPHGSRQNTVTIDNDGRFRGHGCGAHVGRDFYVFN